MKESFPDIAEGGEAIQDRQEIQDVLDEGRILLEALEYELEIKKSNKKEKKEIKNIQGQLQDLIFAIETYDQLPINYVEVLENGKEKLQIASIDELKDKYTEDPEKLQAIDALQAALDVAGFEQTIGGFADLANTLIYSLRSAKAALSGKGKIAKQHILDAGISAIAIIPFADIIKILRLRKVPKLAKAGIKGARATKNYAKNKRIERSDKTLNKIAA